MLMVAVTEDRPQIDFTELDFPSDRLTIRMLRDAKPSGFAQEELRFFEPGGGYEGLATTLGLERELARRAFDEHVGFIDPERDAHGDRSELIDILSASFERYGLSPGVVATEEMVRRLETAAVAQAKQALGEGR